MATSYLENLQRLNTLLDLSTDLFRRAQDVAADRILPDRHVARWLRQRPQILLLATVTILMLSSIGKATVLVAWTAFHLDWPARRMALSSGGIFILEALLLIVITAYVVRKGYRHESAISNGPLMRGFRAENRFFAYWPYVWVSWFLLYSLLSWHHLDPITSPYFSVAANFLNNLSAMFMLSMFVELTEKTAHRPDHGSQQVWLPVLMLLMVLAAAESLFYVKGFYPTGIAYAFGLASGLLVGVVTGLLIAKLSSRLFNLPNTALVALTLFAIVQPVFPVLTAQPNSDPRLAPFSQSIGYLAALVALYAKVVLLIVIEWMRDRFRILYYMVNQAELFENERERRLGDSFEQMIERLLNEQETGPRPVRPIDFPSVGAGQN